MKNSWENFTAPEEEHVAKVRELINSTYSLDRELNEGEIEQLKNELSQIPNLVINFDETMTDESTIDEIIGGISEQLPDGGAQIMQRREWWRNSPPPEGSSKVQEFYSWVIKGVPNEVLQNAYTEALTKVKINENFFSAIDLLKQQRPNVKSVPLVALSLNTAEFIKMFHQERADEFEQKGIRVLGVMGNQVKVDNEGKIEGVYEHVTNENKSQFIPDQAIMLADSRESAELIEQNVNALNIQNEMFHPRLLSASIKALEAENLLYQYKESESSIYRNWGWLKRELQAIKLDWEEYGKERN